MKEFKPPKSLATCADLLYETREVRYALNKQVDALQEKETALRDYLINNLPKSSATGATGKIAYARIELKRVVQVASWDKLQKYIIKNAARGSFALLQRRVNAAAVEEIWAAKKTVPGCEPFNVTVVSVTKR